MSDINAGGLIVFDPADERVIEFDWDGDLAATASIATSTFTIDIVKKNGTTALTYDNAAILASGRGSTVRLKATTATVGDIYWVNNKIVTNETPAQTLERRVRIMVQDR